MGLVQWCNGCVHKFSSFSTEMDLNVDTLLREPELLARVFLFLDQKDLRVVEQVSHIWRELVEQQSIWRRKLLQAKNTRTGWARAMNQMGLSVPSMDHDEAKSTFLLLCRRLLPRDMTEASWTRTGTEQWIYEKARQDDLRVIFQNCPDGTITLVNTAREFTMSTLMVFGHSAFPLLSTADGRVVMASAHFGKGRVLVLPHESLLQDRQLLSGAAQWVSSSPTPIVCADPVSRAGSLWQYINPWRNLKPPFDDMNSVGRQYLLGFQKLSTGPQVYITEGHYDDHKEDVIEYVRRGGGLIIAGHAWFWTSQGRRDQCVFKNHPGNKIISHFGIAFTRHSVERDVSLVPIPTLTTPSRFHLHCAIKLQNGWTTDPHRWDVLRQELIWSADQLRTEEQFKDIIAICDQSRCAK